MSEHVGRVANCQVCGSRNLKPVLSLGHQPIVQNYLSQAKLLEPETTYPLNLVFCPKCKLVELDYVVPPELVFPDTYPYRTGLTNMLIRNFISLRDKLETEGWVKKRDLIIDIGSNDGSLLKPFKERSMRVLGIEPTDAAKEATKAGIPTVQVYLTKKVVSDVVKKQGKASIVTATNVFAHINNVPALIENTKALLAEDGVFVSESQYLMDILEKVEFDTVYHEHLRFYSLKSLEFLLKHAGCTVVDAERISAAGGSIRVYAMKGARPQNARVKKLLAEEKKAGLYDLKTLQKFGDKAMKVKHELVKLLLDAKKDGSRIVAIGSPARSNTLLGFTHINTTLIDYACEKKGSPKIGLFTPGTHIPVVDEEKLFKEQPEYALILSWHIGEELAKLLRKLGYKGKFIIPLTKPKII